MWCFEDNEIVCNAILFHGQILLFLSSRRAHAGIKSVLGLRLPSFLRLMRVFLGGLLFKIHHGKLFVDTGYLFLSIHHVVLPLI
jgi:hypothetical protein